jgi:hypothetical protein
MRNPKTYLKISPDSPYKEYFCNIVQRRQKSSTQQIKIARGKIKWFDPNRQNRSKEGEFVNLNP